MSNGLFITFEGTEGSGKSTQIQLLAERIRTLGRACQTLREPGGTPIGEEIRYTLKHSAQNHAMTPEAELLLLNAARAQLVREVIRPALAVGEVVLCDRFYDSTIVYQGHGRCLDLGFVRRVIDFAVGETKPALTLLLQVPIEVSEGRRLSRQGVMKLDLRATDQELRSSPSPRLPFGEPLRDRMEEADRSFFLRVENGYNAIAKAEPNRIRVIDATQGITTVHMGVWTAVEPLLTSVAASR